MDEAERLSNQSPGPIYLQKVRCTIMQQDSCRKAHQRVLNVLKVLCEERELSCLIAACHY